MIDVLRFANRRFVFPFFPGKVFGFGEGGADTVFSKQLWCPSELHVRFPLVLLLFSFLLFYFFTFFLLKYK